MTSTSERAKNLYTIICNGELGDYENSVSNRAQIIRELEKIVGCEFRNTAEFHRLVSHYLIQKDSPGQHLMAYRKEKGWTRDALAIHLGESESSVALMERGNRPLNDRAASLVMRESMQSSAEAVLFRATGILTRNRGVVGVENSAHGLHGE